MRVIIFTPKFNSMTRLPIFLLLSTGLFLIIGCGKKDYAGDAVTNYPDMSVILNEYLKPYEKSPYTFRRVSMEGSTKDTAYLQAKEINWKELEKPFLEANLYDPKLDKQYKIDVMSDTLTSMMTMVYTSLNKTNYTQKLSIKASLYDNKIRSLYAETKENGFFSSAEYKLLLVTGKTIQIQEATKKPFSSLKRKVTTWNFLNG